METLLRWHTGHSADSVEWCPVEGARHVLVCGTYQLNKEQLEDNTEKQTKVGKIYVFLYDEKPSELTPNQTIETSAILDQKWCHHNVTGFPTLAVATAEGSLHMYRLQTADQFKLKLIAKEFLEDGGLVLSVDWSTNKYASDEPKLVVSDSKGQITLFVLRGEMLTKIGNWRSHGFEAWIAAFDYWHPNLFYSGGDDCLFKCYDERTPCEASSTNRSHNAGVTSMHCNVHTEHQMVTGSYDEQIRLWDTRSLRNPVRETAVGGGVWRLKWHPWRPTSLLAACMHGGCRLLHMSPASCRITHEYHHGSIAYGADWKHDGNIVASCSFYDCQMHICMAREVE